MPKHYSKAELEKKKQREESQKQKDQANQNPLDLLQNGNQDSNSGVISESIPETVQADSFASRAAQKLNTVSESIQAKRGRPPKESKEDSTGDFANLLSSVIVIAFAFTNLTDDLKPTADETGEVSLHAAKIIMRHVDISGRLTGDALDAIGIFAACATYYARVAPALRALKEQKQGAQPVEPGIYSSREEAQRYDKNAIQPATPIQEASPLVKNWLDNQANAEGIT